MYNALVPQRYKPGDRAILRPGVIYDIVDIPSSFLSQHDRIVEVTRQLQNVAGTPQYEVKGTFGFASVYADEMDVYIYQISL